MFYTYFNYQGQCNDDVKTRTNPDIIQLTVQASKYSSPYIYYLFASSLN